jgi:hypothetical protein
MMTEIEMDVHELEQLGELIADVTEVLSDDLAHQWLVEIEGCGTSHRLDLDYSRNDLLEIFWDAAHIVIRDLLLRGYRVVKFDAAGNPICPTSTTPPEPTPAPAPVCHDPI